MIDIEGGDKVVNLPTQHAQISGDAQLHEAGSADSMGHAAGFFSATGIVFVIDFTQGSATGQEWQFNGDIAPDNTASGSARPTPQAPWVYTWKTRFADRIKCAKFADDAQPPAQPAQGPAPAAGRTVTGDVDLYDKPGGKGNIIGQLKKGDAVTASGACPMQNPKNPDDPTNGWCQVTDSTSNLTGAVWGDFISK